MADSVTTKFLLRFPDEETKLALEEFANVLGMSQNESVLFFMRMGMLGAEIALNRPLDPESFGNALLEVAVRFIDADYRPGHLQEQIEEFKNWKSLKDTSVTQVTTRKLVHGQ